MNDRSPLDRLSDAKEYALEARDIARNLDEKAFAESRRDQLAIQFCLVVAGEALSKIPRDIRVLTSEIPWTAINGLRNRLVHGYFLTDTRIILTIAQDRTGPLALAIDRLIEKIK
jgi:uncharacterized protein with HEPN domain